MWQLQYGARIKSSRPRLVEHPVTRFKFRVGDSAYLTPSAPVSMRIGRVLDVRVFRGCFAWGEKGTVLLHVERRAG